MKPTIEQLNELTDYEINCAVYDKIHKDSESGDGYVMGHYYYCETPNRYMPIAIEHGIDIFINPDDVQCCDPKGYATRKYPKAQTGRAVCIAYLLMEQTK